MKDNIIYTRDSDKKMNKVWIAVATTLIILLLAAILILTFVVSPVTVQGESMTPTLTDGERIFCVKVGYNIERGDIIMTHRPGAEYSVVKRVIGLSGDKISIKEGVVYLNGEALKEDYINKDFSYYDPTILWDMEEITVPEAHLFLMGDNRGISIDSRVYGTVSVDQIIGKVLH